MIDKEFEKKNEEATKVYLENFIKNEHKCLNEVIQRREEEIEELNNIIYLRELELEEMKVERENFEKQYAHILT